MAVTHTHARWVEGAGQAMILDVAVQTSFATEALDAAMSEQIKALEADVATRRRALALLVAEKARIQRQVEFVEAYAKRVSSGVGTTAGAGAPTAAPVAAGGAGADDIAAADAFLRFYADQLARTDAATFDVAQRIDVERKEVSAAEKALEQRTSRTRPAQHDAARTTSIVITLEAAEADAKLTLFVSYGNDPRAHARAPVPAVANAVALDEWDGVRQSRRTRPGRRGTTCASSARKSSSRCTTTARSTRAPARIGRMCAWRSPPRSRPSEARPRRRSAGGCRSLQNTRNTGGDSRRVQPHAQ